MNIEIKNKVNQLELYKEFKKYCKYCGEIIQDNGVRLLTVQDGQNSDYCMSVEFIPVSSGLSSPTDSLVVKGWATSVYSSLDELLNIGYEMLGSESFRTKEEVENMDFSKTGLEELSAPHR
ncbi:MAG: hypothetical protein IKR74_03240 [Bacilli bacterium]|nr:hypothetical protein [Bacilli bacterium]